MKIRLMGQPDLVRRWQRELERSYRVKGREYANRGNDPQVRIYFDLDDREAEAILNQINDQPEKQTRSSKTEPEKPEPQQKQRKQRYERDITPQKKKIADLRKRLKQLK